MLELCESDTVGPLTASPEYSLTNSSASADSKLMGRASRASGSRFVIRRRMVPYSSKVPKSKSFCRPLRGRQTALRWKTTIEKRITTSRPVSGSRSLTRDPWLYKPQTRLGTRHRPKENCCHSGSSHLAARGRDPARWWFGARAHPQTRQLYLRGAAVVEAVSQAAAWISTPGRRTRARHLLAVPPRRSQLKQIAALDRTVPDRA
jgi:hypothetical protein